MRDPNRIDKFCEELAHEWKKVYDWRFGQFISNVMGEIQMKHGDIFFPEDNEMMGYIKEYFNEDGKSPYVSPEETDEL